MEQIHASETFFLSAAVKLVQIISLNFTQLLTVLGNYTSCGLKLHSLYSAPLKKPDVINSKEIKFDLSSSFTYSSS